EWCPAYACSVRLLHTMVWTKFVFTHAQLRAYGAPPAAARRPANASRPERVPISVEHRCDLLDVDAFLGHAQVVIRDGDCGGVIGAPNRAPGYVNNEGEDRASERCQDQSDQQGGEDAHQNQKK